MLSHGEESGRDSDEQREARGEDGPHCPVSPMGKTRRSSQEKRKRAIKTEREGEG